MDLTLTEEQALVADTARQFLASRCPMSHVRAMAEDATGYSPELWKEMASLGWTGLALPERDDGMGGSFLDLCLVLEQMGRFQLPGPFVPTVALCGLALARFGDEEQRSRWVGGIARGDTVMSYVRAGRGGSWSGMGSTVEAAERAGGYVLDGTAMFVPYGHVADGFVVVAQRTGVPDDRLTVFVVDAEAGGLECDPLETVSFDHQHRVRFDQVRVGVDALVGNVDEGGPIVESIAHHGAVASCAAMVGGAQQVLDMTADYARDREQFGTRIGSFQAIQHHCANMAMDVLGSRFIAYEAIWRLSEGLDAAEEVSMAKAWVSEAYRRVTALGHQVHGAIGFTREHDLHFYLRHAIASELAFGDGDHHWERVARHLGL